MLTPKYLLRYCSEYRIGDGCAFTNTNKRCSLMSLDLECKAEDLRYINRCFCTLIAVLCTGARLLYMASFKRGYMLGLLSSEVSISVLNKKLLVHQSGYVCFWMSCSLYGTCTIRVMSVEGWLLYLNPIASTCNRCCDCKEMVYLWSS
jgi:hypothetical protein